MFIYENGHTIVDCGDAYSTPLYSFSPLYGPSHLRILSHSQLYTSMDTETEIYVIESRKIGQARKTLVQSPIAPVDTRSSNDYGGSQGHLESIFDSKCPSHEISNGAPLEGHEDWRDSKHDRHAVLAPIKKGTELGYFSTMSATLYTSPDIQLICTNSNLILNKIVGTGIFVRYVSEPLSLLRVVELKRTKIR